MVNDIAGKLRDRGWISILEEKGSNSQAREDLEKAFGRCHLNQVMKYGSVDKMVQ